MPRVRIDADAIERAALALGDEDGLDAITARNLARRLGVTPMALYRHVPSIATVTARLFERVIEEAGLLDHATPGLLPWLAETFRRIRRALLAHPFVIPLAGSSAGYGPMSLGTVEAVLARLAAEGVVGDRAVRVFHGLLAYTLGATGIEAASRPARRAAGDPAPRAATPMRPVGDALAGYPYVRATLMPLSRMGRDAAFEAEFDRLARALLGDAPASPSVSDLRPRSRKRPTAR